MARASSLSNPLIHAGAGTTLVIAYLGLIPGVLPAIMLLALITAVLVLPLVALALAGAVVIAPPWWLWRVATRARGGARRLTGD
jgi:hypothetical protein